MSKMGRAIIEMEGMGMEATNENLGYYIKQRKLKKVEVDSPKEDDTYREKSKEKIKKV